MVLPSLLTCELCFRRVSTESRLSNPNRQCHVCVCIRPCLCSVASSVLPLFPLSWCRLALIYPSAAALRSCAPGHSNIHLQRDEQLGADGEIRGGSSRQHRKGKRRVEQVVRRRTGIGPLKHCLFLHGGFMRRSVASTFRDSGSGSEKRNEESDRRRWVAEAPPLCFFVLPARTKAEAEKRKEACG